MTNVTRLAKVNNPRNTKNAYNCADCCSWNQAGRYAVNVSYFTVRKSICNFCVERLEIIFNSSASSGVNLMQIFEARFNLKK